MLSIPFFAFLLETASCYVEFRLNGLHSTPVVPLLSAGFRLSALWEFSWSLFCVGSTVFFSPLVFLFPDLVPSFVWVGSYYSLQHFTIGLSEPIIMGYLNPINMCYLKQSHSGGILYIHTVYTPNPFDFHTEKSSSFLGPRSEGAGSSLFVQTFPCF